MWERSKKKKNKKKNKNIEEGDRIGRRKRRGKGGEDVATKELLKSVSRGCKIIYGGREWVNAT